MRAVRNRLTYANAMSTLAVALAIGGGTAYAVATIGSADVINESLRGVDVKDKSLSGADLGVRVRSAKQVDDGSGAAVCGQGPDFDECVTVFPFNLPRPQRLLLVGSGAWQGGSGINAGECRFSVGALHQLGLRKFSGDGDTASGSNIAMNSVTGVLDQGSYEIGIDCRETLGTMTVRNTELSVAALGDG